MPTEVLKNPYPLPAFHFLVEFFDESGSFTSSFKEVAGIGGRLDTEIIRENGIDGNRYTVPKAVKYKNLVVKRGILRENSQLVSWCRATFNPHGPRISLKHIAVKLLGEDQTPLKTWVFHDAYPVSWTVDSFHSMENKLAVETIEFCYQFMEYRF